LVKKKRKRKGAMFFERARVHCTEKKNFNQMKRGVNESPAGEIYAD